MICPCCDRIMPLAKILGSNYRFALAKWGVYAPNRTLDSFERGELLIRLAYFEGRCLFDEMVMALWQNRNVPEWQNKMKELMG